MFGSTKSEVRRADYAIRCSETPTYSNGARSARSTVRHFFCQAWRYKNSDVFAWLLQSIVYFRTQDFCQLLARASVTGYLDGLSTGLYLRRLPTMMLAARFHWHTGLCKLFSTYRQQLARHPVLIINHSYSRHHSNHGSSHCYSQLRIWYCDYAELLTILPLFTTNASIAEMAAHSLFSASRKTTDLGP